MCSLSLDISVECPLLRPLKPSAGFLFFFCLSAKMGQYFSCRFFFPLLLGHSCVARCQGQRAKHSPHSWMNTREKWRAVQLTDRSQISFLLHYLCVCSSFVHKKTNSKKKKKSLYSNNTGSVCLWYDFCIKSYQTCFFFWLCWRETFCCKDLSLESLQKVEQN